MMKTLIILLAVAVFSRLASADPLYDPLVQSFINQSTSDSGAPGSVERSASVAENTLYASEVTEDILLSIDDSDAAAAFVCSLYSPVVAGLAYDHRNDVLYGTDTMTSDLLQIDPSSGAVTIIGRMGIELPHGAAIDPAEGTLYVVASSSESSHSPALYTVDMVTAVATLVGPTGQGTLIAHTHRITGISFDDQGQRHAVDNGAIEDTPSLLYRINITDGSWILIGSMDADNILGLAFRSTDTSVESKSWGKIKTDYSGHQ